MSGAGEGATPTSEGVQLDAPPPLDEDVSPEPSTGAPVAAPLGCEPSAPPALESPDAGASPQEPSDEPAEAEPPAESPDDDGSLDDDVPEFDTPDVLPFAGLEPLGGAPEGGGEVE